MAVTITNLGVSTGTTEQAPDIRDLTDATSYTIPSWDPPNDGIVVLAILNGQNTITDVNIDAVTGNGDVWQNLFSVEFSSGQRILTMFAARGSDLTTGSTVINFGTDTQLACYVSIFHITGADESTALSWVGAAESATGTGTSASHNWAASPSGAGSRPLYVVGHVANETITQPGSLTKIDDMNGAGPALGWITAYEDDGFTDPSDSFTWLTSAAWGLLAVEIEEAPTAIITPTPYPKLQTADTQSGVQTTDSTTWTLTYPTNLEEGDLILAVMAVDGAISLPTFPTDWVRDRDHDGANVSSVIAKKYATGSESGNFTVTLPAAEQGCWRVFRISNWYGDLGTTSWGNGAAGGSVIRAAAVGAASTAPDPAALNPNLWDLENTMWIAIGASDGGDTTYTGFPSGYTNTSAQESGGADGAALGIAFKYSAQVASENPGTFTTDASEEWVTEIIAVRALNAALFARPGRRVPKALFGPAINDGNPQVFYTVPAGIRTLVRFVHVSNPGGTEEEFRLAVGDPDVGANRILNWVGGGNGIPANSYRNRTLSIWLNPGETLQGYTAGSLSTIRIDGYERPAG